jgi:hypothetical protein
MRKVYETKNCTSMLKLHSIEIRMLAKRMRESLRWIAHDNYSKHSWEWMKTLYVHAGTA